MCTMNEAVNETLADMLCIASYVHTGCWKTPVILFQTLVEVNADLQLNGGEAWMQNSLQI